MCYVQDESKYVAHITEFVGLKPKCYAYRTAALGGGQVKKAKGISKRLIQRDFSVKLYKCCLDEVRRFRTTSVRLQATSDLRMTLLRQRKLALTAFDSKRYISPCGIHTLALGHWRLRNGQYDTCHVCGYTETQMLDHFIQLTADEFAAAGATD